MRRVKIATRKSPLALWQAEYVGAQLQRQHGVAIELVALSTAGDRNLDTPLAAHGGKGLFLKELEHAVLTGTADIAVHSMKDVTVAIPDGLCVAAICARADPRDALVSNKFASVAELPRGARVGTCSLRRQCQLKAHFPHLQMQNLRGNIHTRLAKLDRGGFDAIVLAAAGLARLQLSPRIRQYISPELCLPAVGQGALGVQCRADDHEIQQLLGAVHDPNSATCIAAERALNARLGGGCHVPLGAYAELVADSQGGETQIKLRAVVGAADGSVLYQAEQSGDPTRAQTIGERVAEDLLAQGAAEILGGYLPKSASLAIRD